LAFGATQWKLKEGEALMVNSAQQTSTNEQLMHLSHQQLLDKELMMLDQIQVIKNLSAAPIDWTQIMNAIVSRVPTKMQLQRLEYMQKNGWDVYGTEVNFVAGSKANAIISNNLVRYGNTFVCFIT